MKKQPIVALESTVIAHGLPWPTNFETAVSMENKVKEKGAIPKTLGIINGEIKIGLTEKEIEHLAKAKNVMKIGTAEIAAAIALRRNAATTVSATMRLAKNAGIDVFATGGIGGVHRNVPWDVSQDIMELSKTRMIVVCAGFKSILDVERTIEFLETFQVTVVGYQTDYMPLFHTKESEYKVNIRADSPKEIVAIFNEKEKLGIEGAILVANPIPEQSEIPREELEEYIKKAVAEAKENGISGKSLTPFLLSRLTELSGGKTLTANIALLKNNASLAGEIAVALSRGGRD